MGSTSNVSGPVQSFERTVRDFWASRPRRTGDGRKLAGVAAAVGARYDIDPLLVRIAFVAMTVFGGIGLSFYLLGWLLFPAERDEVSGLEHLLGRGHSSMSKAFALALCLLQVPVVSWAFGGDWFDGGGFIGLALGVTALYLLHRSRGQHHRAVFATPVHDRPGSAETARRATAPPEGAPRPVGTVRTGSGDTVTTTPAGPPPDHPPGSTAPSAPSTPGFDPLGAAPLQWRLADDHPAPTPPPEPGPPRRRSRVGAGTLGLALVVGGVGGALAAGGQPWFTPAHVAGLVLAVLGTGMVLGSFFGGGRGLLWFAVPLALAGLMLGAVPGTAFRGGAGPLDAAPATAAEVRAVYERGAGPVTLDLTALTGTRPVETTVRTGAGPVTVRVPAEADVTYLCESAIGTASCFGEQTAGINAGELSGVDHGSDGPGGQRLRITASSAVGPVEVERG